MITATAASPERLRFHADRVTSTKSLRPLDPSRVAPTSDGALKVQNGHAPDASNGKPAIIVGQNGTAATFRCTATQTDPVSDSDSECESDAADEEFETTMSGDAGRDEDDLT